MIQRLAAQMRPYYSKLDFHLFRIDPLVSASSNGPSDSRIWRFEETKSLIPCLKDRIGRVEARQFENALYLASQRTNGKPAALAADLSSSEKQLAEARARHVSEVFQINEYVARILALGQRLDRIFQIFSALRIEPA